MGVYLFIFIFLYKIYYKNNLNLRIALELWIWVPTSILYSYIRNRLKADADKHIRHQLFEFIDYTTRKIGINNAKIHYEILNHHCENCIIKLKSHCGVFVYSSVA